MRVYTRARVCVRARNRSTHSIHACATATPLVLCSNVALTLITTLTITLITTLITTLTLTHSIHACSATAAPRPWCCPPTPLAWFVHDTHTHTHTHTTHAYTYTCIHTCIIRTYLQTYINIHAHMNKQWDRLRMDG